MKRAIKKAIQAITLAVLVAGASLLIAGSEEVSEESASNACYYGYDCGCEAERRYDKVAARLERDKRLSACTDFFCIAQVFLEYSAQLYRIEANYRICVNSCHLGLF